MTAMLWGADWGSSSSDDQPVVAGSTAVGAPFLPHPQGHWQGFDFGSDEPSAQHEFVERFAPLQQLVSP